MAERPKDSRRVAGGTRESKGWERQASAAGTATARPKVEGVLKEVLRRENLMKALRRVRSNGGAAGVDGMTVDSLTPYLKAEWPRIREALLDGTYIPQPVRRVEIPKPDGKGVRLLGIPTVLDRCIQQAVLQVLQRDWDPTFSEHSYGFRPGRSAHQAVAMARSADVHSATAQFFINVANNGFLNYKSPSSQGYGYCVFGKVIEGQDVVDKIKKVKTGDSAGHQNVPLEDVIIQKAEVI